MIDAAMTDGSALLKERMAAAFRTRTRDQWCAAMEETDACFAPILSIDEAPCHPHNQARGTFTDVGGMLQPAPAPRYSATPTEPPRPGSAAGSDGASLLRAIGYDERRIAALAESGSIAI